jgi:hypothetical protein
MTRVHLARPQHVPQRGVTLEQSRAAIKKKKPYKILLEAVTQEKKKLHSIVRRRAVVTPHPTNSRIANIRFQCAHWLWLHSCRSSGVHGMVQRAVQAAQP